MNRNELDNAKKFPILFSQVREDPQVDLKIIDTIASPKVKILMIASGGCTLGVLASHPRISEIDAVDANPAQIDLCKLKLFLLNTSPKIRAKVLGHLPLSNRQEKLTQICSSLNINPENFGSLAELNLYGPDYVGRYEWLFRSFSKEFKKTQLGQKLPFIKSLEEQKEFLQQDLSEVRALFDTIFSLDSLIELFGPNAVQNHKTSYSDHFYNRFIWTLSNQFIHSNPFFYQFAYLSYPTNRQTDYLSLPSKIPCSVRFHSSCMLQYLASQKPAIYDYVHLSNILDWETPDSINQLLHQAEKVLKKGGKLCIRQLNSTVEIKNTSRLSFTLYDNAQDLSFFYPKIYIGARQ
jgi:S-adenosylmethionine-diacylglycerol 3-amino-3-carboxypropyl transferase